MTLLKAFQWDSLALGRHSALPAPSLAGFRVLFSLVTVTILQQWLCLSPICPCPAGCTEPLTLHPDQPSALGDLLERFLMFKNYLGMLLEAGDLG